MIKESKEQSTFIKWIRLNYPDLTVFHIPNGEYRDILTSVKLKRMGVLPGVFDLYCMDYHLFIEFKQSKKNTNVEERLTNSQKRFMETALKTKHNCLIFNGFVDGVEKFKKYIKDNKKLV